MSPRVRVSVALGAAVIALGACSGDPEPEPSPVVVTYSEVSDETGSEWFTVNPTAVGGTNVLGDWELTLGFTILHANGVVFDPVATVRSADGDEVVCRVDDLRRLPSVRETTTEWDLPCAGPLPTDPEGVTVTVTDDYA